jgi:hypothetical protein
MKLVMVKGVQFKKLADLMSFPVERDGQDPARSTYERFAIPYSFKPRLSVAEALIAAGGALLRILLGSILFAVWGAYTFLAVSAIKNVFLRGFVLLALIALFAVLMALLMLSITALVRLVWPRSKPAPTET